MPWIAEKRGTRLCPGPLIYVFRSNNLYYLPVRVKQAPLKLPQIGEKTPGNSRRPGALNCAASGLALF